MNVSVGFMIKKALGQAFMPLSVCLFFFALGMIYILLRRSREALAPFVIGALLLFAFSLNVVAGYLIRPLERAYPPLTLSAEVLKKPVKWVVVLGSGHWTDQRLPAAAMLNESALFRLAEGMRVANSYPASILIFSGGKYLDEQTNAQVMAAAAVSLGFDPARIVLSEQALDTHDEAKSIKEMVGADTFVMVTSASHMVRAVKLFQKQGLSPIPAPTYYLAKGEPEWPIPNPRNIYVCHCAVHEYMGLAWSYLRGQISFDAP